MLCKFLALFVSLNSITTSIGFYHPIKIDVIKIEKNSISSFIDEVIYNLSLFTHKFEEKKSSYSSLFRRFNRIQKKVFIFHQHNTFEHDCTQRVRIQQITKNNWTKTSEYISRKAILVICLCFQPLLHSLIRTLIFFSLALLSLIFCMGCFVDDLSRFVSSSTALQQVTAEISYWYCFVCVCMC